MPTRGVTGPRLRSAIRGPPPERAQLLLLVYPDRTIRRATTTFTGMTYMSGPPSWTPDGRALAIPWQRAPHAGERGDHVHCLGIWTASHGYRSAGCGFYPHFDTISCAPDGRAAVTDGSQIISLGGRLIARVAKLGPAVGTRWILPRR